MFDKTLNTPLFQIQFKDKYRTDEVEAVVHRFSAKKLFLIISKILRGVFARDTGTGVFLWIVANFLWQLLAEILTATASEEGRVFTRLCSIKPI